MDFEEISISSIVPAEYNPRLMPEDEYDKLRQSINRFGLVDPIIINLQNNHIIGGHQRYDVLMNEHIQNPELYNRLSLLRFGDIGWVFVDEEYNINSLEEEKTLNITLNKISGAWDPGKLENLFKDINMNSPELMGFTGFNESELKLFLDDELSIHNLLEYDNDETYDLPDDYMDVTGHDANKNYVVSIGFPSQSEANKFLEYYNAPRTMTRDTFQCVISELDIQYE